MTKLKRNVLRTSPSMLHQLRELAGLASDALGCDVSQSAVARTALREWLEASASRDPAQLFEAIRLSMIKRGRKAGSVVLPSDAKRADLSIRSASVHRLSSTREAPFIEDASDPFGP
jgi:hypothetical protein